MKATAIIPALDEEETIGRCVREALPYVEEVIVVDNGSQDSTANKAREAGARVVLEPVRGYGHACLRGVRAIPAPQVLVFMDGDGSDCPEEIPLLLDTLGEGYDLVVGSRIGRESSLPQHSLLANMFFGKLMGLLYGKGFRDLGPFRAIRYSTLSQLGMEEMRYGWTAEMQVKALKEGFRVAEVSVSYRERRGGKSKVTGSPLASFKAALSIMRTILRLKFNQG